VHTGLRDLLPPGGLSLCPIDAESGAHGALLGASLESLLAGRRLAMQIDAVCCGTTRWRLRSMVR
jgi:hypothetical protein